MKKTSLTQLVIGLTIVILGVGFLVDNIGLADFGQLIGTWWPLALIALGAAVYIGNPRHYLTPAIIIGAGLLLQLRELDVLNFNVISLIWPALLIIIGLRFLFGRTPGSPRTIDEDVSDIFVIFSGVESKNKSAHYRGGKVSAMFGGVTLDLRDSELTEAATLDVFVMFGGVELRLPEGWRVHVSGTPVMGGWEDKTTKPTAKNAPTLTIQGACLFGGVEVKN